MSFEKALEDAAKAKSKFIEQLARSGGMARKADSLQGIIIDIVRQRSSVSLGELLKQLQYRKGDGTVDEIDETHIYFVPDAASLRRKGETTISVPISGLKHRLTRARKIILKEGRSR